MPTQETVKELLEKVRAAEKPSRQLDFAIRRAVYGSLPTYDGDTQPNWVREYTGNLDACLSLLGEVLPGSGWGLHYYAHLDTCRAEIWEPRMVHHVAKSPPIAMLHCILQTLIEREDLLSQQAVKENT